MGKKNNIEEENEYLRKILDKKSKENRKKKARQQAIILKQREDYARTYNKTVKKEYRKLKAKELVPVLVFALCVIIFLLVLANYYNIDIFQNLRILFHK